MSVYEQVLEKFKNQNINVDDYYIFVWEKEYANTGTAVANLTASLVEAMKIRE